MLRWSSSSSSSPSPSSIHYIIHNYWYSSRRYCDKPPPIYAQGVVSYVCCMFMLFRVYEPFVPLQISVTIIILIIMFSLFTISTNLIIFKIISKNPLWISNWKVLGLTEGDPLALSTNWNDGELVFIQTNWKYVLYKLLQIYFSINRILKIIRTNIANIFCGWGLKVLNSTQL